MGKLNRLSLSETVIGLMLMRQVSPLALRADSFPEPYPDLVREFQKRKEPPTEEDVIEMIGPAFYETVRESAARARKLPANWPRLLEVAAARYESGVMMERMARKLMEGEEVDLSPLQSSLFKLDHGYTRLVPLSKIKADKNPFQTIGYEPLDTHLGGLPRDSMTIIGGRPGVGKTWFLMKLAEKYVQHTGKRAIIFSLEMTAQQFAYRAKKLAHIPKAALEKIDICDDVLGAEEVSTLSSRLSGEEAGLVGVDFAELLIENDQDQGVQTIDRITRSLARLAQRQRRIVVLLSQLNRATRDSRAVVPGLGRLRYAGEAPSAMVLNLINPKQSLDDDPTDTEILNLDESSAGVVAAKSRFGFKHGGPGVIEIPWTNKGWGNVSIKWHRL